MEPSVRAFHCSPSSRLFYRADFYGDQGAFAAERAAARLEGERVIVTFSSYVESTERYLERRGQLAVQGYRRLWICRRQQLGRSDGHGRVSARQLHKRRASGCWRAAGC